ncbi:hypothetical protein, partial [Pseudoalteromonas sp. GABNS16H]|uniref:hypothetical protein n=1 Tax=Pseudoalteromonas sp. GABNS16H TaxID=3025325 RepID=UPI00235E8926
DRESPVIPEGVHEAGFLKIDITPIKKSIELDKRNGQNILEQADVLFKEEDCKLWLSHPRLYSKAFIEEKGKILDEYKKRQEDVKRVRVQRIDEMAARRDSSELQKKGRLKKSKMVFSMRTVKLAPRSGLWPNMMHFHQMRAL